MVKRVFKISYDFEKLEIWLNEMAQQGWMMESFFAGLFKFSKGTPGEYIYRAELLPYRAGSPKNLPYLHFLEGIGAEIVATWVKWGVYRRKACEGAFDVYSDIESRIKHYRRVSRFLFFFCIIEWILTFIQGRRFIEVLMSADSGSSLPIGVFLFGFLFPLLVGLAIFRTAWRFDKSYRHLKREEQLHE